ncbi:MAG: DEAD/DEAH box helicase [Paracoccaceae bacterium]
MDKFRKLGVTEKIVGNLRTQGICEPTLIQLEALPVIFEGRDVLGLAQTGTGKTVAFGVPMLQKLMSIGFSPKSKEVRALVLVPTRELAKQIVVALKSFQG